MWFNGCELDTGSPAAPGKDDNGLCVKGESIKKALSNVHCNEFLIVWSVPHAKASFRKVWDCPFNHRLHRSIALLEGNLHGIVDVIHPSACEW